MATLRRRITPGVLAVVAATLVVIVGHGQALEPSYQVYAVRYATAPGFAVSSLVAEADESRTIDIPFMIWVLKGPDGRNVLVDAGSYHGPVFSRWTLTDVVKPSDAIAKVGLTPDQVTDVIISHVHWDHVNGADLFPKARVWIQRAEYEHYVGDEGQALDRAIADDDAVMLFGIRKAGRLMLVDGDAKEIIPGITVYTGGKHTFAAQYVGVRTAAGTVVVASDNVYLYENLEKHLPIAQSLDPGADAAVQARMLELASAPRLIVPGHDPAVFERFPKPGGGVARIE